MSPVRLVEAPSFDDAAFPLALADLDGCFVRVNDALAQFLGRPVDEILGHEIVEFTHPDDVGLAGRCSPPRPATASCRRWSSGTCGRTAASSGRG